MFVQEEERKVAVQLAAKQIMPIKQTVIKHKARVITGAEKKFSAYHALTKVRVYSIYTVFFVSSVCLKKILISVFSPRHVLMPSLLESAPRGRKKPRKMLRTLPRRRSKELMSVSVQNKAWNKFFCSLFVRKKSTFHQS
jgi:hypothetical protein